MPRKLTTALLTGALTVNIALAFWAIITRPELNNDFRGLYAFSAFARPHAAQLYQPALLQAFQHRLYPGFISCYPYQYPPSFLPAILWLASFPFPVAQALWSLAGLAALIAAAWRYLPAPSRLFGLLALLASPAALLNFFAGETGFFTTALLLAGFANLARRPGLAGIAFGLLTVKPQFFLLIPIALLAGRNFRALAGAAATALGLAAFSCLLFPPSLWPEWLRGLAVTQPQYLKLAQPGIVTLLGNLVAAGAGLGLAYACQAAACLLCATVICHAFRRASPNAVPLLFAAIFLATPHAYAYDTLPLIAALILPPISPAIAALVFAGPYLLLLGVGSKIFFYAIPEALLFVNLSGLAIFSSPRPDGENEPFPAAKRLLPF